MTDEKQSKKSLIVPVVIVVVIIAVGIGAYFIWQNSQSSKKTTTSQNTNQNTNTAVKEKTTNTNAVGDPYADLMKYDGKLITISSSDGKVDGRIGIKIIKGDEMPIKVITFLKVKDNLPKKATSFAGASYHFVANHAKEADIREGDGIGALSPAFCNKDQMPDVLTLATQSSITFDIYSGCDAQNDPYADTNIFYQVYASYYNNYTFNYDEIVGKNKFVVFDTSPYYYKDTNSEYGGYQVDYKKAVQEGEIVASYDLTFSE